MHLIIIIIIIITIAVDPIHYIYYANIDNTHSPKAICDVALLGDSLINVPWGLYNLRDKVESQLDRPVNLYNYGVNGDTIGKILDRTDGMLANVRPQAVILFWDSDISDINESILHPDQKTALRENYKSALRSVGNKILATGSLLVIVGPGLLGEGPIILNDNSAFIDVYASKNEMLNDYREMNEEIARELNVPYLDIRKAFLDVLATTSWKFNNGCITQDGEHPNENGAVVEANLFSAMINNWLRSSPPCSKL